MAPTKSKSLEEHEKLAKNIKQIRKNIRKKHQVLTQNVIDEERLAEKSLKPVITPLQKLVEEKTKQKDEIRTADIPMNDVQLRTSDTEMDSIRSQLKRPLDEQEHEPSKRLVINPAEETVYETLPSLQEVLSTPEGQKSADYYVTHWLKGSLVKQYMHSFLNDSNRIIDRVYGPYFGSGNTLMIGRYPITFENDDIIINNVRYDGTPGLYELIFMKRPDEVMQTEEDLNSYSRIIKETAAYLNLMTNKVKSSSSFKYRNIIKPIIMKPEGRGLMRLAKPNYIHWDDVNELCERLHLLISSRNAGHSGHDNEILSIIEELHEAGIIKEDAGTVEAIFTR